MVEVMNITATFFKRSCACTAILNAADPAAGLRGRLLDTHLHNWVRLLWVRCLFLLGPVLQPGGAETRTRPMTWGCGKLCPHDCPSKHAQRDILVSGRALHSASLPILGSISMETKQDIPDKQLIKLPSITVP